MIEKIVVPDIGEGVESGKVVAVHIKEGDMVKVDDTLVELETDKAVVEIPSTVDGKVVKVLAGEGDEIKVGDAIAEVETDAAVSHEAASTSEEGPEASAQDQYEEHKDDQTREAEAASEPEGKEGEAAKPSESEEKARDEDKAQAAVEEEEAPSDKPPPASPSIRRMARELGADIRQVRGSGAGGRISESDIKAYVKDRLSRPAADRKGYAPGGGPELPDFTRWGEVETRELETVRRITAESTATSWHVVPHVTQFDEADITAVEAFLSRNAEKVAKAGGKLTLTAVLTKVCAAALKKFPRFNASLDLPNQRIIYKKNVHIGIAVDTPRGLLMPVIRDADTKSITALAVEIVDLAERSRDKKIKPTELEGGTFSISNQGGIGGVAFTPIVLWPQVAILGVSRASTRPRFVNDRFEPRKVLPLSLSYDHRIIDGADAARFLGWICESLAYPFTPDLD